MIALGIESKNSQRIQKALSTVVKGKVNSAEAWKEVTEIKSVSRTGAGFSLERECQIGQLLSLLIPLPTNLRCYDEDKELYRVWGLIQHCSHYSDESGSGYHIGVAFVGRNAPASYRQDPEQSYKISGMSEAGLWKISEATRPFVHRKTPRYWASVEVSLSVYDFQEVDDFEDSEQEVVNEPEITITENISLNGALVFSKLNVDIGDCINFVSSEYEFTTLAMVRNRTWDGKTMPKVHLEFISQQFPIHKMHDPIEEAREN
jgi:hypothetical protein